MLSNEYRTPSSSVRIVSATLGLFRFEFLETRCQRLVPPPQLLLIALGLSVRFLAQVVERLKRCDAFTDDPELRANLRGRLGHRARDSERERTVAEPSLIDATTNRLP